VKVRTLLIASVAALLIPLMVGGIFVLGVATQLPAGSGARIEAPHGAYGVMATGSYAWVVPAGKGKVVIVDAGQDPDARSLSTEVGGREVVAILLTHAHADTIAGIDAFPDAPVYLGPGEKALLTGETESKGWMAAWLARSLPRPRLPEKVEEVADGQELELGQARFRAVHLPGHTGGSVAWVWRDVVFVGDALLVQPSMMTMMAAFSDDEEQAKKSLEKLLAVDFDTAADARGGLRDGARAKLADFLNIPAPEPSVQMMDAADEYDEDGVEVGELVVLHGVVRVDPRRVARNPDAAPELVTDDGRVFRLPPQAVDTDGSELSWMKMINRPVSVRARPMRRPLGAAADPRPLLVLEHVERDRDTTPSAGPVERIDPASWRRGQWVELVGPVDDVAALSSDAIWGEATLGGVVGAVPVSLVEGREGQVLTALATVTQGGAEPRFAAHALCVGDVPSCGVRVRGLGVGAPEEETQAVPAR
jgi:glyoxylase-like metal-dependent hydrolase (beta-lactamase superfamily II)